MTKNPIATLTLLACATIAQLALVAAQIPDSTSALHGNVTDPSGAVIQGAMVTISSGSFNRTVSTDELGQFSLAGLAPGHYRVRVHFGGFGPFDRSNFVVTHGRETEANAQLELKEARQAVTVYE